VRGDLCPLPPRRAHADGAPRCPCIVVKLSLRRLGDGGAVRRPGRRLGTLDPALHRAAGLYRLCGFPAAAERGTRGAAAVPPDEAGAGATQRLPPLRFLPCPPPPPAPS